MKLSSQELLYHQSKVAYYRNEQSYKCLFLYFHPTLYRFAFNILHDKSVSEEIVSDIMLKVWEMGNKLSQIQYLKIFLITSVKNACFTYLSSKKHQQSLSESIDNEDISTNEDNPEQLFIYSEVTQRVSLVIDRYGYSQIYVSHGLYKYYQMTGDDKIKKALITHAKWQRDNPSINHQMESLLATLHGLSIGYEFTKDPSFLKEGIKRAQNLITDKLPLDFNAYKNQKDLSDALEKVSHLPDDKESFRREAIWKITNGLRIFGWTHMFGIPYLQNKMDKANLTIKSK